MAATARVEAHISIHKVEVAHHDIVRQAAIGLDVISPEPFTRFGIAPSDLRLAGLFAGSLRYPPKAQTQCVQSICLFYGRPLPRDLHTSIALKLAQYPCGCLHCILLVRLPIGYFEMNWQFPYPSL